MQCIVQFLYEFRKSFHFHRGTIFSNIRYLVNVIRVRPRQFKEMCYCSSLRYSLVARELSSAFGKYLTVRLQVGYYNSRTGLIQIIQQLMQLCLFLAFHDLGT